MKFRFKTEKEFIREYGLQWRWKIKGNFKFTRPMNCFLGCDIDYSLIGHTIRALSGGNVSESLAEISILKSYASRGLFDYKDGHYVSMSMITNKPIKPSYSKVKLHD